MSRDAGQGRGSLRLLEYADLWGFEYLSAPDLSPDGAFAAFVVSRADPEGRAVPRAYEIDLKTKAVCPLGGPDEQDLPAYSPDGRLIACLGRPSPQGEFQIYLHDRSSGETRKITRTRHGVSEFAWAPDGRRLAFTARCWPGEDTDGRFLREMTQRERADWEFDRKHAPVAIENLMYKSDGSFGVRDRSVSRVCLAEAADGKMVCLTAGEIPYGSPAWSPDGTKLAFYGKPFSHVRENQPALFLMDLVAGNLRQLDAGDLVADDSPPVFTADGKALVYGAYAAKKGGALVPELFLLALEGGEVTPLFPKKEVCHGVGGLAVGRTAQGRAIPSFQLGREGKDLCFLSAWKGKQHVCRLPLEGGGRIAKLSDGRTSVHAFRAPAGDSLLLLGGDHMCAAELLRVDLQTGATERLTRFNRWMDGVRLSRPRRMRVRNRDGKVLVHGYVAMPAANRGGPPCPGVLYIHGGPDAFYARDFWFEAQMLAARGFAVICCDPRGSAGYGAGFASDAHAWGEEAVDDLYAFLDAALALRRIDGGRLGVTGGSYGGWMTNRLIASTGRFGAAVTQRSLCNLATSYGTGDMGFIWKEEGMPTQMQNFLSRIERSPITAIDCMKTPLLILHATNDYRCSFEQAEQLFVAMKDRNPEVPVRLVAFPGENHEMTRSGKTGNQIRHLQEMCGWFERFLKEGTAR